MREEKDPDVAALVREDESGPAQPIDSGALPPHASKRPGR